MLDQERRTGWPLLCTPNGDNDVAFWIDINALSEDAKSSKRTIRFAPQHITVRNNLPANFFRLPSGGKPALRNDLLAINRPALQDELPKPAIVAQRRCKPATSKLDAAG